MHKLIEKEMRTVTPEARVLTFTMCLHPALVTPQFPPVDPLVKPRFIPPRGAPHSPPAFVHREFASFS